MRGRGKSLLLELAVNVLDNLIRASLTDARTLKAIGPLTIVFSVNYEIDEWQHGRLCKAANVKAVGPI